MSDEEDDDPPELVSDTDEVRSCASTLSPAWGSDSELSDDGDGRHEPDGRLGRGPRAKAAARPVWVARPAAPGRQTLEERYGSGRVTGRAERREQGAAAPLEVQSSTRLRE